jgi:hypothetical protein
MVTFLRMGEGDRRYLREVEARLARLGSRAVSVERVDAVTTLAVKLQYVAKAVATRIGAK